MSEPVTIERWVALRRRRGELQAEKAHLLDLGDRSVDLMSTILQEARPHFDAVRAGRRTGEPVEKLVVALDETEELRVGVESRLEAARAKIVEVERVNAEIGELEAKILPDEELARRALTAETVAYWLTLRLLRRESAKADVDALVSAIRLLPWTLDDDRWLRLWGIGLPGEAA